MTVSLRHHVGQVRTEDRWGTLFVGRFYICMERYLCEGWCLWLQVCSDLRMVKKGGTRWSEMWMLGVLVRGNRCVCVFVGLEVRSD